MFAIWLGNTVTFWAAGEGERVVGVSAAGGASVVAVAVVGAAGSGVGFEVVGAGVVVGVVVGAGSVVVVVVVSTGDSWAPTAADVAAIDAEIVTATTIPRVHADACRAAIRPRSCRRRVMRSIRFGSWREARWRCFSGTCRRCIGTNRRELDSFSRGRCAT
jgi:hypothetical protein